MTVRLRIIGHPLRQSAHRAQHARITEVAPIPPATRERLAQCLAPRRGALVLHGRESALEHELEVIDARLEPSIEPWYARILVRHPRDPLGLRPFLERLRRTRQRIDISIRAAPLRR